MIKRMYDFFILFYNRVGTYNFDVSTTFPLTDKDSYYYDGL